MALPPWEDKGDSAGGDSQSTVTILLASGCFWGRQHDIIVDFEMRTLNRTAAEITTVGGYAGGTSKSYRSCYYNDNQIDVYSEQGHAEAVSVQLPAANFIQHASKLFELYFSRFFVELDEGIFVREDIYDQGPGYRAFVAFRGGISNLDLYRALQRASTTRNVTFVAGQGNDPDTFLKGLVYVLDSDIFPFHQAELCLQLHDNQTGTYSADYHALKRSMLEAGTIHETNCPPNFVVGCED